MKTHPIERRTPAKCLLCSTLAAGILALQACAAAPRSSLELDPELAHNRPSMPTPARGQTPAPRGRAGDISASTLPELQQRFQKGLHADVLARARSWEVDPASLKSPAATRAAIYNLYGMSLLLTGRPEEAEGKFKVATSLAPDKTLRSYHAFNWAASLNDQSRWTDAREVIEKNVNLTVLDPVARAKATSLRAKILLKTGDFAASARGWIDLHAAFRERFDRSVVADYLRQALAGIADLETLAALRRSYESSELFDEILARDASLAGELEDRERAREMWRTLLERHPKSSYASAAENALRALREDSPVRAMTIGALLPMTGKFARFGRKALQGLELALGIHGKSGPENRITLVIEDSGDETEKAIAGLIRLHSVHQVQLVIGPMTSRGIDSITRRSEELGLPIISLAQQSGVDGEYIFPIGLTPQAQARVLAAHSIGNQNLKRFAIAYPRNRFGEQYAFAFWQAIEALGGDVRGIESYDENETDFRGLVDRLVGLDPLDARGRELAQMARDREEQNITKRSAKTDRYYSLPPLTDFEAIFIADEPKRAAQIIPTFEFRDVNGLNFLGTASWNSTDLITRMPVQAERSVFTDAYNPRSEESISRKFSDEYRQTFGQDPSTFDSLAYDAGTLARRTLESLGSSSSRDDIRAALRSTRQFIGVSGRILSDDYRDWERSFPLLTVRKGQIVSAER